ncbi:hypothetical protein JAAARDRAFT_74445, partial [Jaapia argillacea MUCL 33604]
MTPASLARTCRSFHEPALDILWKRQYSLKPLWKCLPSDLWDGKGGGLVVTRPRRKLIPLDWDRFIFYARRIRALHAMFHPRSHATCSNDETLHYFVPRYPRAMPILPNVEQATWQIYHDDAVPYDEFCFGDKTKDIMIFTRCSDERCHFIL